MQARRRAVKIVVFIGLNRLELQFSFPVINVSPKTDPYKVLFVIWQPVFYPTFDISPSVVGDPHFIYNLDLSALFGMCARQSWNEGRFHAISWRVSLLCQRYYLWNTGEGYNTGEQKKQQHRTGQEQASVGRTSRWRMMWHFGLIFSRNFNLPVKITNLESWIAQVTLDWFASVSCFPISLSTEPQHRNCAG